MCLHCDRVLYHARLFPELSSAPYIRPNNITIFSILASMGTNYSQPLRGYKYSEKVAKDAIPPYEPQFPTFASLYLNQIETQKNLPFLNFAESEITFGRCLDFCSSLQSMVAGPQSLGVFARASPEAAVATNTALLFGTTCLLCDPDTVHVDDFVRQAKSHKVSVVICSPQDQKRVQAALARDSSLKNVAVICGKERLKGKAFVRDELPEPNPDRVVFLGGGNERRECDCISFIPEWIEKLKLSRDAVVVSMLPVDSQLSIILHCACVLCRARLFFVNSLVEVGQYNPTHLFTGIKPLEAESKNIEKKVSELSLLARIEYNLRYPWKKYRLSCGSEALTSDRRSFVPLRIDLGTELHYIFCDGILEREAHELLMMVYGKPVINVFAPNIWRNLGAALPCDIRFVKPGTVGGPVVPRIHVDEETKRLVGDTGLGCITLDHTGWWDEEGSLVVYEPEV